MHRVGLLPSSSRIVFREDSSVENLISRLKTSRGWGIVLIAGLAIVPPVMVAKVKGRFGRNQPSSRSKTTLLKHPRKSSARTVGLSTRRRSVPYRYRLAHLRLRPERVVEIQQALIQAGYLNQEPSGRWDEATRAAMRRYQSENNLPVTGLPEAKTLMKLGLGPHPLPTDVDPSVPARASMDNSSRPAGPANPPVNQDPDPPRSPRQD